MNKPVIADRLFDPREFTAARISVTWYDGSMNSDSHYDNILIRDATILVRRLRDSEVENPDDQHQLFDVRTGVQLKEIHPGLQLSELDRGYHIAEMLAASIIGAGAALWIDPEADPSKVVTILEVKQRKLDSVVADSILDQVKVIRDLLQAVLDAAEKAKPSERFWLSQQLLTTVRKFSGRELSELEEMTDWFRKKPKR